MVLKKKTEIFNWDAPPINTAHLFNPAILCSEKISDYPLLCCSTYYKSSISVLGDACGKIYIVDTDPPDGDIHSADLPVNNSSIFDINWYRSSLIVIASGEIDLITMDIAKTKIKRLRGHQKTIRSIKKQDSHLYTCGGDGKIISWDLRTEKPAIELYLNNKSKNIISSLEIHKTENHLIFGTSTPGTTLNTWDIRYTQRGLHISKNCFISKHITNDIFYHENFLYFILSDGSLIRTTETGVLMNILSFSSDFDLKTGKIVLDYNTDMLIAATGQKIIFCDPKHIKYPMVHHLYQSNGIDSVYKKHFFTYDDHGNIILYNYGHNGRNLL